MKRVEEFIPQHFLGTRKRVQLDCGEEVVTEQCHRETCNINNIMARYNKSGHLPPNTRGEGFYADVSEVGELLDVKTKVSQAYAAYNELPEEIRNQFNSPEEFVEYVEQQQFKDEQSVDKIDNKETSKKDGSNQEAKPEIDANNGSSGSGPDNSNSGDN